MQKLIKTGLLEKHDTAFYNSVQKDDDLMWLYQHIDQFVDYKNVSNSNNKVHPDAEFYVYEDVLCNAKKMLANIKYAKCKMPELEDVYPTHYGSVIIDINTVRGLFSLEIGKDECGFYTDYKTGDNYGVDHIKTDFNSLPLTIYKEIAIMDADELFEHIVDCTEDIIQNFRVLSDLAEYQPEMVSDEVENFIDDNYITINNFLRDSRIILEKLEEKRKNNEQQE